MAAQKMPKPGSGQRFRNLTKKLTSKGATNPAALAGFIGRKKYGKKKMAKMSSAGRKKHKSSGNYHMY